MPALSTTSGGDGRARRMLRTLGIPRRGVAETVFFLLGTEHFDETSLYYPNTMLVKTIVGKAVQFLR